MGLFLRGYNWFRRFRHRCGYGVHSPSDFYFITFIIYEKLNYYSYSSLHHLRRLVTTEKHYREKVDKLLFRIINYLQPTHILEFGTGSGLSTRYMLSAKPSLLIDTYDLLLSQSAERLLHNCDHISFHSFTHELKNSLPYGSLQLVHIAFTDDYEYIFNTLITLVNDQSCFIISSPYKDSRKSAWWHSVIDDPRVGITFDLYDIGIVFFDKKRIKENRIVNFL